MLVALVLMTHAAKDCVCGELEARQVEKHGSTHCRDMRARETGPDPQAKLERERDAHHEREIQNKPRTRDAIGFGLHEHPQAQPVRTTDGMEE